MEYLVGFVLVIISGWLCCEIGSLLAAFWSAKKHGRELSQTTASVLSSLYAIMVGIFGPPVYHPTVVCGLLGLLAALAGTSANVWFAVPLQAILYFCGASFLLSLVFWAFIFNRPRFSVMPGRDGE